ALRMVGSGNPRLRDEDLGKLLREPTPERIQVCAEALRRGYSVEEINGLSHIDRWFLQKLQNIVRIEGALREGLSEELLLEAKRAGFSDARVAELCRTDTDHVRKMREAAGIVPRIKQIDTLAGEYPAQTNYLYLTYNGTEDYIDTGDLAKAVLVLGSGAYRIGSSVEFDWCAVNTVQALRRMGYGTIML